MLIASAPSALAHAGDYLRVGEEGERRNSEQLRSEMLTVISAVGATFQHMRHADTKSKAPLPQQ